MIQPNIVTIVASEYSVLVYKVIIVLEILNSVYKLTIIYEEDMWHYPWPHPPSPKFRAIKNVKTLHKKKLSHILRSSIGPKKTPSTKYPVRNHQHPTGTNWRKVANTVPYWTIIWTYLTHILSTFFLYHTILNLSKPFQSHSSPEPS